MSGKLFITTVVISAAVTALIVIVAGSAAAVSISHSEVQAVSSLVLAGTNGSQGPGYIQLAGAKVRDHRSCAPNCGSYNPSAGRPGHGPGLNNPPPLADKKIHGVWPQPEQGGVSVKYRQKRWNIPCLGNAC